MIPEIIAVLVLTIGILGRWKYVWQGNRVRKTSSSKDVSEKFIVLSWVTYGIMFAHNYCEEDLVDQLFWLFGFFTSMYAMIMIWKYSQPRYPFWKWIFWEAWK